MATLLPEAWPTPAKAKQVDPIYEKILAGEKAQARSESVRLQKLLPGLQARLAELSAELDAAKAIQNVTQAAQDLLAGKPFTRASHRPVADIAFEQAAYTQAVFLAKTELGRAAQLLR